MADDRTPATLEFWFDFGSNYSYLSVMRMEDLARQHGVDVQWRPFLLGPIFQSFGWQTSPFVEQKEKGAYVWKDMARQCAKYGLALRQPSVFPRTAICATRVALLGADAPWGPAFCRRVMECNFADDRDIGDRALVADLLTGLGLPAEALIAAAEQEDNKQRLRQQVAAAQARKLFGAPTFFVGNEMFWGNDRLDDALAFAAARRSGEGGGGA